MNGMAKTNKRHFGGGDTAWEEEKLGDYTNSEVRLVEVQEHLCSDVDRGQQQCYRLAEEWEHKLEDWWFKHQKTSENLYKWMCIENIKHCCPENTYGPECKPCIGYPDNVCSNNGKCKGSGTRKGNGDCSCDNGYSGPKCEMCAKSYYEAYRDDEKLLCSKCHISCEHSCSVAGPIGCHDCKAGWFKDQQRGCLDVNECLNQNSCKTNEFCINKEGSYTCLACDRACESCHGDGPDMCEKCAQGYILKDHICVAGGNEKQNSLDWNRYFTYLGLCIATCIIFQKNTVIASVIGLSVAIYVSVSEYMLSTMHSQSHLGQEEISTLLEVDS
ncbi:hypothetical protein AAG570_013105 [Ranatra chinensis]|uniref:EGF-like domain-containing protein n=1 Tax=Ranatra chinensis TaxID=642074 RepID=A0ABD0YS95_9HEMI